MKSLAIALFMSTPVFAQSVIDAPVDHVFVPAGFDNNDNVELVVTGLFPNPCFKRNDVSVDVRGEEIDVKVSAVVSDDEKSPLCAAMVVPFKEDIQIGNLQGGQYKIFVNRGTPFELRDTIVIGEAASQNQDDHLYAMVSYIELGFTGGTTGSAMLVGWNPSSCMELDRVEYRSNGKDTLVIQPIMKKVSDFCPMKMTPLNIPVSFDPSEFKHSEVLLMSRTIEGRSVNNLAKMK
mgnify:CR=1 FL=1